MSSSEDEAPPSTSKAEVEEEEAAEEEAEEEEEEAKEPTTFKDLGIDKPLRQAFKRLGWKAPTPIQLKCIPHGLKPQDIVGLAQTGSGKTGAFAIPIVQALLRYPTRINGIFALCMAPTRELAVQINEQFQAVGSCVDLQSTCILGGMDMMQQAIALSRKPHVVVATPGRLKDHLEKTKGFSLANVKFLVLDEADRLMSEDFEEEIKLIVRTIGANHNKYTTFLFSATMTAKVEKLQRFALNNPVRISVDNKYQTVSTLLQQFLFIPAKFKDCYLVYLLSEFAGKTAIVFLARCLECQRLSLVLKNLGFSAVPLHGKMTQPKRLGALNKFKSRECTILLATDVAARGLDIPKVDFVINYDIPLSAKDYVHRVGRTARAGNSGKAINLVTQYDVEVFQRIEEVVKLKMTAFPCDEAGVLMLQERVAEAQSHATVQMKEQGFTRNRDSGDKRDNKDSGELFHGGSKKRKERDPSKDRGGRRGGGRGGGRGKRGRH
eukprot:gnl/Hemi2/6327_TR2166_c0_g1_i1.p1 gnl/Hemi2/6327_TR2166_c0_g1~~gnl/Hemi2/6327_TR2166_c0_g1_i1.p1  ORF type:complete len:504 (+),score=176.82 gnl/Hemi2/6327_TR2166_c0_g1_i1:34-1512(+)